MKRFESIWVVVSAVLLSVGCASTPSEIRGHWADECSEIERCALLKPAKEGVWAQAIVGGCTTWLREIDGRKAINRKGREVSYGGNWAGKYEIPLLPGEHEIVVGWCILGGLSAPAGTCVISPEKPEVLRFDAEVGHSYVVEFAQVGQGCQVFVVDETEGQRVLEEHEEGGSHE